MGLKNFKLILKGSIFTITSGEYEDYCVLSICRAIIDINPKTIQEEYLSENPKQKTNFEFNDSAVTAWMVKMGYVEDLVFSQLHLGEYGFANFRIQEAFD